MNHTRFIAPLTGPAAVRAAMRRVRRTDFLSSEQLPYANDDRPLPIDCAMTTSQPSLIAKMIAELQLPLGARVLEVGTGCGYQTALLAELCADVYSVDIVEPLAKSAAERLAALGYRNVHVRTSDGYLGWAEAGPFDGIVVAASAPAVPAPLIEQLKPHGRLVIPVGHELLSVDAKGQAHSLGGVRFVPLTGVNADAHRVTAAADSHHGARRGR